MNETEQFLKELTEAYGVSGAENDIRKVMAKYLAPHGTLSTSHMGSLICDTNGTGARIAMVAHMDEIGFIVRHITDEGFLKFLQIGGWWDQVLLGHRVIVQTNKGNLIGVIGAKPPHVLPASERTKVVEKKEMYIDIGASSKAEVEELGVRVGDFVVPDSRFDILANGKTYVAKAFDDRIGCAVMVKVLENLAQDGSPNHVIAIGSTFEETSSVGAKTAMPMTNPQIVIILESGIAGDVPGLAPEDAPSKLGKGPAMSVLDGFTIYNTKLRELVIEVAQAEGINLQVEMLPGGGTDADVTQGYGEGVPTVTISVPSRHIHSHNSIIHQDDFAETVKLVTALVRRLDETTIAAVSSYEY